MLHRCIPIKWQHLKSFLTPEISKARRKINGARNAQKFGLIAHGDHVHPPFLSIFGVETNLKNVHCD